MKSKTFINHIFVTLSVLLVSLFIVMNVSAASKSYHGLTTVIYNNIITDFGGWYWNGGYYDSTNPSFQMDQFGVSYWSTWDSCNWVQDLSTKYSYSNIYHYNVSVSSDGMAQSKIRCPQGQTLRGHDYVQHWWQDGIYSGDGGTLNTYLILSNP